MSFVGIQKALKPQTLYKFHFHENILFNYTPQTSIINKTILRNDETKLINKSQTDLLQKSFDMLFNGRDNQDLKSWSNNRVMNKLYSQVYYPFLTKAQLNSNFSKTSKNLLILKKHILDHVRVKQDALLLLKYIQSKPKSFDFGILRSNYFASLGLLNDYSSVLKSANFKIFRHHLEEDVNYSKPLSNKDNYKNEEILSEYLYNNAKINRGFQIVKNYLIINSSNQSEFFISMASKLNINVILLTNDSKDFVSPSSTIDQLIQRYETFKKQRNVNKCKEIHNNLNNMKLISIKSSEEMMKFSNILQDPYLRLYDLDTSLNNKSSFNNRLLEMELNILGDIETKGLTV